MKCKNCGSELKENAKFCTTCGVPIEEVYNFVNDSLCEQQFVEDYICDYEVSNQPKAPHISNFNKKKMTISAVAILV